MLLRTDKSRDAADIWSRFGADLLAPYKAPYRQFAEEWFEAVHQRQSQGENLKLSYFKATDRAGKEAPFNAWALNGQMFFSADPRVMALPYPQTGPAFAGIWLHDFGKEENKDWFDWIDTKLSKIDIIAKSKWRESFFYSPEYTGGDSYVREVCTEVRSAMVNQQGVNPGKPFWMTDIRLARLSPTFDNPHNDGCPENKWGRVIVHSFRGTGIIYTLNEWNPDEATDVAAPTGTTACHLQTGRTEESSKGTDHWGAIMHRAGSDPNGRGVIVFDGNETPMPERTGQSPWMISRADHKNSRFGWLRHLFF